MPQSPSSHLPHFILRHFGGPASGGHRVRLLMVAGFAMLTLGVAAVVHLHEAYSAVGDVAQWASPAAPVPGAGASPLVVPVAAPPTAAAAATTLPWTGQDFWHMLTDETARTTRAQLGLVHDLEAAVRSQIEQLLAAASRH